MCRSVVLLGEGWEVWQDIKPYLLIIQYIFFFLLALQPPLGVVFYSPLVGFSLLAYEVS